MDRYRVAPGTTVDLTDHDPGDRSGFEGDKEAARARKKHLRDELADLQRVLWAGGRHKVLIVLQAMDTGGKDGTIRSVFRGVNPQGVRVANFKVPTEEELAHDYLWRVHDHTPATGGITVFNRSHYEDVLVVRVLGLVPEERWRPRYRHIREFERLLVEEGTTVLKFYLHIDKETQRERLQARLDDPAKHWKFNTGDLKTRDRWDDYMAAYAEAISETSTAGAPWYVVPANREWYRNLVVAEVVTGTLRSLDLRYPEAGEDLSGVVVT
jgi:PPK2 family polyphosphate:nucleotide phosphotransferase